MDGFEERTGLRYFLLMVILMESHRMMIMKVRTVKNGFMKEGMTLTPAEEEQVREGEEIKVNKVEEMTNNREEVEFNIRRKIVDHRKRQLDRANRNLENQGRSKKQNS